MTNAKIRPCVPSDMPALKALVDAAELFPAEMLDGMVSFETPPEPTDEPREFWLVHDEGETPVATACCAPERMTVGTWNLLLIVVHPDHQGGGIGVGLMRHVEALLAARGDRVLLVETSGTPAFERTRGFYARVGYEREARIRDYYDAGDDKIVFRRAL